VKKQPLSWDTSEPITLEKPPRGFKFTVVASGFVVFVLPQSPFSWDVLVLQRFGIFSDL
jgi:hypothetical protein